MSQSQTELVVPVVGGFKPAKQKLYEMRLRGPAGDTGSLNATSATEAMIFMNYVRRRCPHVVVTVRPL